MDQEQEITSLYLHEKWSVAHIANVLKISEYSVNACLRKHSITKRSIAEAITVHHMVKFGKSEFRLKEKLSSDDELLRMAGIMLYWGEGSKKGNVVALSNSNPEMIQVFLTFLRTICGVDEARLRIGIHYYEDLDADELIRFWSAVSRIPAFQFHKPYLHSTSKGTYREKSSHGTVLVKYADVQLLRILLVWIADAAKALS